MIGRSGWTVNMTEDCDHCSGLHAKRDRKQQVKGSSPLRSFKKRIEVPPSCAPTFVAVHGSQEDMPSGAYSHGVMAAFTPRQTSRTLHGKPTQVFLQTFADRIMVLVTQIGKVGNLVPIYYFAQDILQIQTDLFRRSKSHYRPRYPST